MVFGALERKRSSAPMGEINMTPLIDVMLVLLVIFMLAAPLLVSAIKVELPRQGGVAVVQTPMPAVLVLDATGQAYAQEHPLDEAALSIWLARVAASDARTELHLQADARVPHGRVVEVMALAQRQGIARVGFVTRAGAAPAQPGQGPAPGRP